MILWCIIIFKTTVFSIWKVWNVMSVIVSDCTFEPNNRCLCCLWLFHIFKYEIMVSLWIIKLCSPKFRYWNLCGLCHMLYQFFWCCIVWCGFDIIWFQLISFSPITMTCFRTKQPTQNKYGKAMYNMVHIYMMYTIILRPIFHNCYVTFKVHCKTCAFYRVFINF